MDGSGEIKLLICVLLIYNLLQLRDIREESRLYEFIAECIIFVKAAGTYAYHYDLNVIFY
jgi:hypothetical protein